MRTGAGGCPGWVPSCEVCERAPRVPARGHGSAHIDLPGCARVRLCWLPVKVCLRARSRLHACTHTRGRGPGGAHRWVCTYVCVRGRPRSWSVAHTREGASASAFAFRRGPACSRVCRRTPGGGDLRVQARPLTRVTEHLRARAYDRTRARAYGCRRAHLLARVVTRPRAHTRVYLRAWGCVRRLVCTRVCVPVCPPSRACEGARVHTEGCWRARACGYTGVCAQM